MVLPSSRPDESARYRDRRTGRIETERVFGSDALHFLYETRRGRFLTDHILTRPWVNHLYGLYQRGPWSRKRIRQFVDSLGIDASEAELPLDAYPSLDAFFARRLRAGARPIDPTREHLVSPCDARLLVYPRIDEERLRIKGQRVDLADMLLDPALAQRYREGSALVFRLAPADYHRFHFPAEGRAGRVRRLGGRLHSVHPIALAAGAPSFRNQRHLTLLETERFGRVLMVEVGALLVGTIVQTSQPGPVARGQEKGLFRFGGSTVVLLLEPGRVRIDDDLVESSAEGLETLVHMGTKIGRALAAS